MTYEEQQQMQQPEPQQNSVQEKIAKAKKISATLKQIEKLEKEVATYYKKIEQKEQKIAELAKQL